MGTIRALWLRSARYRVNSNSSLYPAFVGGNYNDSGRYGMFCFSANVAASSTDPNLSSRLIYKP